MCFVLKKNFFRELIALNVIKSKDTSSSIICYSINYQYKLKSNKNSADYIKCIVVCSCNFAKKKNKITGINWPSEAYYWVDVPITPLCGQNERERERKVEIGVSPPQFRLYILIYYERLRKIS